MGRYHWLHEASRPTTRNFVFFFLEYQTVNKVQKACNTKCKTPLSEDYRFYLQSFVANRQFDTSTFPKYAQTPKTIVFARLIDDRQCERALAKFTSSFTSANCNWYCNLVVQSYQCSLFFIRFRNFLNKISEIMGRTMKIKELLTLGSLTNESLIEDVPWNPLTSINGGLLCIWFS
jgi:hypothetical protein